MKYLLWCIMFLMMKQQSLAQENLDSLWALWNNTNLPDTIRLEAIDNISYGYLPDQPDSAEFFAQVQRDYAESRGLKKYQSLALWTQAYSSTIKGNNRDALELTKLAYELAKEAGAKKEAGNALKLLGSIYEMLGEYANALDHFDRALTIFEEIGYKRGQAGTINDAAIIYLNRGEFDLALDQFKQSFRIMEDVGDEFGQANALNNSGLIYSERGEFAQALDHFKQSERIMKGIGNKKGVAMSLGSIGRVYAQIAEYDLAIEHFNRSLELKEEIGDRQGVAVSLEGIGHIYKEQGKLMLAMDYHNRSLAIWEEIEYKQGVASTLINIGSVYRDLGEYAEAIDYFTRGLKIAEELEINIQKSVALSRIGRVKLTLGKYNEAVDHSQQSLKLSQKLGDLAQIKESAHTLYEAYKNTGKPIEAFGMLELYLSTRDSLESDEKNRELLRVEFQYKYEKEKQELAFQQEQERLIQEQEVSRLQWIIYGSIGMILLLVLLAFLVYRNYRIKQQSNQLLAQQNQEISNQKRELQELDKLKSRFFANISHELRTPLTLISGPLESLLHSPSKEEINKTLPLAIRNTKKLKELVNDILDLSKVENKGIELRESSVDLPVFLRRIWANYESMADQLSIDYKISIEQLDISWILMDSKRVEKILNNLLFNAIKYTSSGGKITLTAQRREDTVMIEIADTGQGIAREDLPHIFDRYFQSKQSNAPIQGGTGIGLALAHELAYLMGGDITVESELHKGSTFTLIFPLMETEAPVEEVFQKVEPDTYTPDSEERVIKGSPKGPKHKVLIVEDNADMRAYLNDQVQRNYLTSLATHGVEALEMLKTDSFDLIITDVMMPEMDGYALVQHLKSDKHFQGIPVIMLTALNMEDNKLDALALGVDDYLTKPFSPLELQARISNLIDRYRERKKWMDENYDPHRESEMEINEGELEIIDQQQVSQLGMTWLQTVKDIVLKELENPEFQVADLANQFHLSKRQFFRRFKTLTGLTPKQFQVEVALQKARELLEKDVYHNASAVAYSVGMQNVSRFNKAYFERFGKYPKEYFE
ncbi:MAG: tetratricopeptide repeat protein [Cytophagales bacterium]|nr:tetratricopeptide repeat protein [Cytophagales bacterium]